MASSQLPENGILYSIPSRTLPQEMLLEIFMHCVQSDDVESPSSKSPPFTLTWVCQYWRRVAISYQHLWTRIKLGESGTDPVNDARLFDLWLSRAGPTRPLYIKLYHEMKDSERSVFFEPTRRKRYRYGMGMLTYKLVAVSHRWRALELHTLDMHALELVFRELVSGAPQLEYLSISTKYFDYFYEGVHSADLSHCPELRSMRLLCPILCPARGPGVANNMTSLEIGLCPSLTDCMTWLSICPNLEILNIRFRRMVSALSLEDPPLVLSRLSHLKIACFSDDSEPSTLLGHLTLPVLQDLSLDMNGLAHPELNQSWSDQILSIIRRSSAPLERLTLFGTSMASYMLVQLLKLTPRLRHLALSGSVVSEELLRALGSLKDPEPGRNTMQFNDSEETVCTSKAEFLVCPSLESLELREFDCPYDAIVSSIASRYFNGDGSREAEDEHAVTRENIGTLKQLILTSDPQSSLLNDSLIQKCVSGGLSILNRDYS
ncbi:hypothetical protein DFH11DRAFT_1858859 [Phellopilus nigrolimitatus]|nr:hypothetical protein DFH11DRAFT_1858859 [Phellopilus nigrolimitatus]